MGLFKTKEEKEAERKKKKLEAKQLEQRISNSAITQQLQQFLLNKFGDLNSEEVDKLRQLAASGGRAGYLMDVQKEGILFKLINGKGELLDKWAITFDALGYQDLPSAGVNVLEKILRQTLESIPHLMVLDTGFFMYKKNREKLSW